MLSVKITVFVTPKTTVLDPQGQAVQHAMHSLGHSASNVRVGKTITFDIEGEDTPAFRSALDELCKGLLSNPIIEDYRYTIESQQNGKDASMTRERSQTWENAATPLAEKRP